MRITKYYLCICDMHLFLPSIYPNLLSDFYAKLFQFLLLHQNLVLFIGCSVMSQSILFITQYSFKSKTNIARTIDE